MRKILFESFAHGPLTEAAPEADDAALAELAAALDRTARKRLGRSLSIREVEQSLGLIEQILAGLPPGPVAITFEVVSGEGLGLAEGFRGDVLVWLRLDGLRVARCHLRDPSWFQWPLLEAAIEGNIVADFPLCNKSFNCSYSGHDL